MGDDIEYVEKNGRVQILGSQPNPPSWGLARIAQQKGFNPSAPFLYPNSAGKGVTVYVIDTGVHAHPDFNGRASTVKSFVDGDPSLEDGHGHGTHVSGTIASTTYGIAKNAIIKGVKVLNAQGSGTYAGVIAGIDYVGQQANPGDSKILVANMSLGGGKSQAVDDAIKTASDRGVFFAVAAGNNYKQDACSLSPAGAPAAFAVAASDNTDTLASFSNVGKCVKIIAPGVSITSTWNNGGTNSISGTSMASPHVAGVAALVVGGSTTKLSVADVGKALQDKSTRDQIKGLDAGTVNYLLYDGGEAGRRQ